LTINYLWGKIIVEDNMLSPCGIKCDECKDYENNCNGCRTVLGKVYWTKFTKMNICPIFECVILKNKYKDCGECKKLPCKIYYDTKDPSQTNEEHKNNIKKRIKNLKE
jgi:hypothetical protein